MAVLAMQTTAHCAFKASAPRPSNARGRMRMETVPDTLSTWKMVHGTATEVRWLISKENAKACITDGVDSLVSYRRELVLLRGLSESWPTSLSDPELINAHEITLSILGVNKNLKNAIANPSSAISIGGCCEKALYSYARAACHLARVYDIAKKEMQLLSVRDHPLLRKKSTR